MVLHHFRIGAGVSQNPATVIDYGSASAGSRRDLLRLGLQFAAVQRACRSPQRKNSRFLTQVILNLLLERALPSARDHHIQSQDRSADDSSEEQKQLEENAPLHFIASNL